MALASNVDKTFRLMVELQKYNISLWNKCCKSIQNRDAK